MTFLLFKFVCVYTSILYKFIILIIQYIYLFRPFYRIGPKSELETSWKKFIFLINFMYANCIISKVISMVHISSCAVNSHILFLESFGIFVLSPNLSLPKNSNNNLIWTVKFNSIQDYLYSVFHDTIVAKQLYRKSSFYNRFIYFRILIFWTYGKMLLILYILWGPPRGCIISSQVFGHLGSRLKLV